MFLKSPIQLHLVILDFSFQNFHLVLRSALLPHILCVLLWFLSSLFFDRVTILVLLSASDHSRLDSASMAVLSQVLPHVSAHVSDYVLDFVSESHLMYSGHFRLCLGHHI